MFLSTKTWTKCGKVKHLATLQRQTFLSNGANGKLYYSSKESSGSSEVQSLPAEADVVIIGGGSLGCNTLYSLAKLGITNTVLLEKDRLTAGTTWHTAGLVWRLRPSDVDISLLAHTHSILTNLEAETGVNPGWINNGGLFIANNKERLDEYKRLYTIGKVFGIESYVLSPSETKKLYPLMNVDDIYGTLYSPTDGTIDPTGMCEALTRSAKKAGAKVFEKCSVTNVLTEGHTFNTKKVIGVETKLGTIKTKHVVNCTGAWANDITNMVGVHIPLIAMKHAYVTTEQIPGIENMPNVRDHDASVYLKLQGDALHIGGYENNPVFLDRVEKDFAFGLYELDWDVFGVHIKGACNRVPCLEKIDHKPILGEDPRVRGFFHGTGFNSGGMMFGAGCGNELAKWIVHGRPELDMYGYDIRRFCPETSKSLAWIKERSHESYAKNYSMIFLHDEPLAGRNMKKDALYDDLAEAGCVYQERHGWERSGWFTVKKNRLPKVPAYDWYGAYDNALHQDDPYKEKLSLEYTFEHPSNFNNIRAECLSTRHSAALFNMSYFGKFFMTGPDAQAAADFVFSNRMDVPVGKTVYTCMLNKNAGVEADLTVSIQGTEENREFYIAAAGGAAYQNLAHIQQTVQDKGFNVNIRDATMQMAMISIQGPKSRTILESLTDADLSNESFPFSSNRVINVCGKMVLALRVSFVGELGWELHIPNEHAAEIYREVMKAGQPHGLVNAGYRAIDSLSIEKGYPHWHQELRMDDNPLESGLMFTCKLKTSTDFQGRSTLEKIVKEGTNKKKVCFTLDDKSACLVGLEAIFRDGVPVGYVRRSDYGFYLDKQVAYGYVKCGKGEKMSNDWLKNGKYEIEMMGTRFDADLHLKSPFDPKNQRVMGDYRQLPEASAHVTSFLAEYRGALEGTKSAVGFQ